MSISIKTSVAMAVLAVSTAGVSACGSSASKAGAAAAPTSVAGSASSATTPAIAPSTADPAAVSSSSSPANPANPTSAPVRPPAHTDIPDRATLVSAALAPSHAGPWQQHSGAAVPAWQIVDPDNCDPVARPQFDDANYPRNPAWVNARTVSWADTSNVAQVSEAVVTYTSAAAASADFAKHRGWVADCAAHFQWTDMPAKYSVSTAQLPGVPGSYAVRVAMDPPNQTAAPTGSQGIDYMAVILRGDSMTFVSVSETGPANSKPQDPGLTAFQHDVQVAAAKLSAVYAQ